MCPNHCIRTARARFCGLELSDFEGSQDENAKPKRFWRKQSRVYREEGLQVRGHGGTNTLLSLSSLRIVRELDVVIAIPSVPGQLCPQVDTSIASSYKRGRKGSAPATAVQRGQRQDDFARPKEGSI
jgi:hypothetical protein